MSSLRDSQYKLTDRNLNGIRTDAENLVRSGQVFNFSTSNKALAAGASLIIAFKTPEDVILQFERMRASLKTTEANSLKVIIYEGIMWNPDSSETRLMPFNLNRISDLRFAARTEIYEVPNGLITSPGNQIKALPDLGNVTQSDFPSYFAANVWYAIEISNSGAQASTLDLDIDWGEIPPGATGLEPGPTPPPSENIPVPGVVDPAVGVITQDQMKSYMIEFSGGNETANALRYEFINTDVNATDIELELIVNEFDTRRTTLNIAGNNTAGNFFPGGVPDGTYQFNIIARAPNVNLGKFEAYATS